MKKIDINPKDYERGKSANERGVARIIKDEIEPALNELIELASKCPQKVEDLEARVAALEGVPGNSHTRMPADVYSKSQLIAFAQALFPDEFVTYADDLRPFCRKLRDALAAQYPNIERINDQEERFGYSASDEKHSDAFYRVDTNEIIDFMINADASGVPLDRLSYSVNQLTPW